jgi:hypothetical protein
MNVSNPIPLIRRLCADLSEEEITAAEQNFRDILATLRRIAKARRAAQSPAHDSTLSSGESTIQS